MAFGDRESQSEKAQHEESSGPHGWWMSYMHVFECFIWRIQMYHSLLYLFSSDGWSISARKNELGLVSIISVDDRALGELWLTIKYFVCEEWLSHETFESSHLFEFVIVRGNRWNSEPSLFFSLSDASSSSLVKKTHITKGRKLSLVLLDQKTSDVQFRTQTHGLADH